MLFRPRSVHACQQSSNPSHDSFPLIFHCYLCLRINIETKANLPVIGLCGRYLSVSGPEPHSPYPPPPPIGVYNILIHTRKGGGGRVDPERRLEGQYVHVVQKDGSKIPTYL